MIRIPTYAISTMGHEISTRVCMDSSSYSIFTVRRYFHMDLLGLVPRERSCMPCPMYRHTDTCQLGEDSMMAQKGNAGFREIISRPLPATVHAAILVLKSVRGQSIPVRVSQPSAA